jgi:hypothetical protein
MYEYKCHIKILLILLLFQREIIRKCIGNSISNFHKWFIPDNPVNDEI